MWRLRWWVPTVCGGGSQGPKSLRMGGRGAARRHALSARVLGSCAEPPPDVRQGVACLHGLACAALSALLELQPLP